MKADAPELESLESLENLNDLTAEEEVSIKEIWKQLQTHEELYIVINAIDEARLKKSLSNIKAKQNAKFKESGLPPDNSALNFETIEDKEIEKHQVCLHITLVKPESIKIHKVIIPKGFE